MSNERRQRIADWVRQSGSVRVAELAAHFDVSEVTIRADLARLEKDQLLVRDHGGATAVESHREVTSLLAIEARYSLQRAEKQRIAEAAARLVQPGDTIYLDAGTTVVEMIPFLAAVTPLTIVTNAVPIAVNAAATTSAEVILLGGTFNRVSASNLGAMTERSLGEFLVDRLFLGTQAADVTHGLTDTTIEIANLKRAMIRSAREVVLLADATKWGASGFIKVAPLSAIHAVISDAGLPADVQARLKKLGLRLTLA
jgi:DeoR family transcriptional regulator of aga operon